MIIFHENLLDRPYTLKNSPFSPSFPFGKVTSDRLSEAAVIPADPDLGDDLGRTVDFTIDFRGYREPTTILFYTKNVQKITVDFLVAGTLLETEIFDDIEDQVPMIKKADILYRGTAVRLTIKTRSSPAFIGSMYIGKVLKMPPFDAAPKIGSRFTGRSTSDRSGLTFSSGGVDLKTFSGSFSGIKMEKFSDIETLKIFLRPSAPAWIDPYPENHSFFMPFFARNLSRFQAQKSEDGLSFDKLKFKFEECR